MSDVQSRFQQACKVGAIVQDEENAEILTTLRQLLRFIEMSLGPGVFVTILQNSDAGLKKSIGCCLYSTPSSLKGNSIENRIKARKFKRDGDRGLPVRN